MRPSDLPIVSQVFDAGPDDRVFDVLLLVGPLVVVFVAAVGRTLLTEAIAGGYLASVVLHVAYRALVE